MILTSPPNGAVVKAAGGRAEVGRHLYIATCPHCAWDGTAVFLPEALQQARDHSTSQLHRRALLDAGVGA